MSNLPTLKSDYSVKTLFTQRLELRPAIAEDRQFIITLEKDPDLMLHVKEVLSDEEAEQFFKSILLPWQAKDMEWTMLIAVDKSTKQKIGCFSLRFVHEHSLNAEIGFLISPNNQNKGYASEGAMAVKEFLFNDIGMRRVCAFCNTGNIGSWKVMETIGLQREGLMRQEYRINDVWHDTYVYGEIRDAAISKL
ncbi:GNAT family protein [Thalassotalea psychrophila]|uniref:GNAT family protein n=1 Tax=Thalassotalea psychrophila TaxID=3065647 RepID=A0ABY9TQP0_9GAMM|nr:GNAT family protein [Colwelliaceae bacterium SQ149]